MRTHSILLILACFALIETSLSQAPFDYDNLCRTNFRFASDHIFPDNWKILLDSYDYESLLAPGAVWASVDTDGDGLNWRQSGGVCQFNLDICTFRGVEEQQNWLFTQYVSYEEAQEILFDIDFRFTQCTGSCQSNFVNLHIYEVTDMSNEISRLDKSNYKKLRTLQQQASGGTTNVKFNNRRSSDPNILGFYLALEDIGTCGSVRRLLTYHLRAPGFRDSNNLVTCPDTALPPSDTTELSTSSCTCDMNAVSTGSLERVCDVNGVCSGNPVCACMPGYELSSDGKCTICPAGTFKATVSNTEKCTPCPANSFSLFGGAAVCDCDCNTVRPANTPGADCSRPPSSPIVANGMPPVYDESGVTIFWYPAIDSGKSEEVHYNIYSYNSAEKVYIKENTNAIEANLNSDLLQYTLSNDLSALNLIVTSASTATGDEETISELSQVQNRFILFYVSFEKQTSDITTELDDTTTEATIITSDPTTEAPEATTTITTEDITTAMETTTTEQPSETTTTEQSSETTTTTTTTTTEQPTEAVTTESPFIVVENKVPNPLEIVIQPPEVAEVIVTIDNDNNQPPPPPATNLHFTLGGQTYLNGSTVSLSDIGEGENALLCVTDNEGCCRARLEGEFHYPDTSLVPVRAAGQSVFRNRGTGFIRLNFNGNAGTPLGQYRCAIPDASNVIQSLFITIQ